MKTCSMCKNVLSEKDFYVLKSSPSGLQSRCKSCAKKYNEDKRESINKRRNKRNAQRRDILNARANAIYKRDREKILQRSRERYATEKGKLNNRIQQHKRRARRNSAVGTHTAQDVLDIFQSQNGKCAWCGCDVSNKYHVDHVIPLSRGGSDAKENLVISCKTCNLKKYTKIPEEFLSVQ